MENSVQDNTPNPDELLTVQEAAALAGIGETAIRNALQRGRLPFEVRYGRKLIKVLDLTTYRANAKPGRPQNVGKDENDREQVAA